MKRIQIKRSPEPCRCGEEVDAESREWARLIGSETLCRYCLVYLEPVASMLPSDVYKGKVEKGAEKVTSTDPVYAVAEINQGMGRVAASKKDRKRERPEAEGCGYCAMARKLGAVLKCPECDK